MGEIVNAQEVYYENSFGVQFIYQEYNFFNQMYWEGYQDYITQDDYNEINDHNLFSSSVIKHSLVNRWNGTPTIKSYDVIGVRVDGVEITSIINALVSGTNYDKTYSNPKRLSNGFGFSIQLPNTSNVKISVTFYTNKGGTIYGSYQHAMRNTTKSVSLQYNSLSSIGYGGVFDFNGMATSIYDRTVGVDINV